MGSLLAASLLLVVHCLADSASRPSHVVKVGRNGRQLVHRDGQVGLGARLGRKVRRKGRNTLPSAAPQLHHHDAPTLVRAVPQVACRDKLPSIPKLSVLLHLSPRCSLLATPATST